MSDIQTFQFQNQPLSAVDIDGKPWFIAKEVCDIQDISNNRQAVARLDNDARVSVKLTTLIDKGASHE